MSGVVLDPHPYADFMVRHLLKPLPPVAGVGRAISETELAIGGDNWFWSDDNAKALELLALPEVWRRHPAEVEDVVKFVLSMCDSPFIFRRLALPRLDVTRRADGKAEVLHGLMNVNCDLKKGLVNLGVRFHDGRTARNVMLTGNYVRFSHKGRVYVVDVEDHIDSCDVMSTPTAVRLLWRSDLHFTTGLGPFAKRHRLGAVTYTVSVHAGSMFVDCAAQLDLDSSIEVSDVTLTIGHDDLSHNDNNVRYESIHIALPEPQPPTTFTAHGGAEASLPAADAEYWSIAQRSQISGFALAVHSLPSEPSRLANIAVVCKKPGLLHWVTSEHMFSGRHRGGSLAIVERKILTAGGFYELTADYARMLRRFAGAATGSGVPVDVSISYDYGAEIGAFARCFRTLSLDEAPVVAKVVREQVEAATDHFFGIYQSHFIKPYQQNTSAVFSRSLAFVGFAYADMFSATRLPQYAARLREVCGLILSFERQNSAVNGSAQSGFAMGREHDALPYVDCHASCLLALVRATEVLNEAAWLPSIDRGLSAFRIDTVSIGFQGKNHKEDLVGVDYLAHDGVRHTLHTFWNFTAGLALRLFNALRAARHPGLRDIWSRHATRIGPLEWLMCERIQRSLRQRDGLLEIRTSVRSGETNSETQPWVALGLTQRF